jgi:peptidoglycan hydrolase-like protein with peptidoglycan-binding domain
MVKPMARSARSPEKRRSSRRTAAGFDERPGIALQLVAGLGASIARNPVLVGGTTAFLVAMSYVSANALWYQPHFHADTFFATRTSTYQGPPASSRDPRSGRATDVGETTFRIDRSMQAGVTAPGDLAPSDPNVAQVQSVLHDLNFYSGPVDGLEGPNTHQAIKAYQKTIGLPVTGEIDGSLIEQLGASATTTAAIAPVPSPRGADDPAAGQPSVRADGQDPRIVKIQAGLKAFGNDDMEIDGVVGSKTKAAVREFQSLFGLPVSGEPDEAVYLKMREIGLTN